MRKDDSSWGTFSRDITWGFDADDATWPIPDTSWPI